MITNLFHLGKKPYHYKFREDYYVILLGKSEWDEISNTCKLYFMYSVSDNLYKSLEELNQDSKILGFYQNRSRKFSFGQFSTIDAQRYIKSRYRDIIRQLNRQQSGEDVYSVISGYNTY